MSFSRVTSAVLSPRAPMVLALVLALAVSSLACGGAGSDESASEGAEATGETAAATDTAQAGVPAPAEAGTSSPLPPMPQATAEDGTLPRTYLGWELGGPAPDVENSSEDQVYDEAVCYTKKVSDSPNTFHRAFVQDGQIFRIEWMVDAPGLDRAEVTAALAEHLGKPDEKSRYMPDNHDRWSDGITEGKTTWWVGRPHNGDFLVVAVMDSWLESEAI